MLRAEYVRNLNCNYKRVLLEQKPEEKRYQYCILSRGGIKGLLPCSLRYINDAAYLYYDISSRQNLSQLYGSRNITRKWLTDFGWGLKRIGQELERFLLDSRNIVWYPDEIFQELENNQFSFLYIPYYEEEGSFESLLNFLVEHIDYNDETLVECVYSMYEQYERGGEAYLQGKIFEDIEKLNAADKKDASAKTQGEAELPGTAEVYAGRRGSQREGCVGDREEREAIERKSAEESTQRNGSVDISVMWEKKRGILGILEGKKRKGREQRENYRKALHQEMLGCAVAEETMYEEAEYGQTVYVEVKEDGQGKRRGLYYPDGRLLQYLDKESVTIGKMEEADVLQEDSSVSRLHARIVREGEYYYLEDLNSTNGTFKNGLRLAPYEKRKLEEGDDIRCGRLLLIFR